MMKDMMGPTRAKKYFPVVGTAACFVFFANFLGCNLAVFQQYFTPTFIPRSSAIATDSCDDNKRGKYAKQRDHGLPSGCG